MFGSVSQELSEQEYWTSVSEARGEKHTPRTSLIMWNLHDTFKQFGRPRDQALVLDKALQLVYEIKS